MIHSFENQYVSALSLRKSRQNRKCLIRIEDYTFAIFVPQYESGKNLLYQADSITHCDFVQSQALLSVLTSINVTLWI